MRVVVGDARGDVGDEDKAGEDERARMGSHGCGRLGRESAETQRHAEHA